MKCPYCNKSDFVPEVAIRHAEAYGGGCCKFKCNYCRKVVHGHLEVRVRCVFAEKTSGYSDWPE